MRSYGYICSFVGMDYHNYKLIMPEQTWHSVLCDLRILCLSDYRSSIEDMHDDVLKAIADPDGYMGLVEGRAVDGDDNPLRIEKALRHMCDITTKGRVCTDLALNELDPIFNCARDLPDNTPIDECLNLPSSRDHALASSLAAYVYLFRYLTPTNFDAGGDPAPPPVERPWDAPLDAPLDNILSAAFHASSAANMQFRSQAMLLAGDAFRSLLAAVGLDGQRVYYPRYAALWRALAQNDEERRLLAQAQERTRVAAGGRVTGATECACVDCPVTNASGGVLSPCPGACPPDLKAWYCSEKCWEKDIIRHVPICGVSVCLPPPSTITIDEDLRRSIENILKCDGPRDALEMIVPEDSEGVFPAGKVVWVTDPLPDPYRLGKTSQWAYKVYE
ncbi:hypothetical protein BD413DRAFT_615531 [Trametes elegans]|nr:hypothetical protein BD413DRAFT_615531 [Trametes elegans]